MKKLTSFLVALIVSVAVFAQKNLVVSAYNYLKDGKLDKALASIEPASKHPQTMSDAKTWLYRGNVYLSISMTKDEKYKKLCSAPLDSAYNSYQKSISIDKDYIAVTSNPPSAKLGLYYLGDQYFNVGADHYNKQDWANARFYFERTKQIKNSFGDKDSVATFYAAQAAIKMSDNETAMKYMRELVGMNYQKPEVYSILANLYKEAGDTARMLSTIELGRKRFSTDLGLIISETNYYLTKGDYQKAQELLKVAVEKDPNNPILHYTIGTNYDKLVLDTALTVDQKEAMLAEAEKSYKKAIELKPDYFDAYYNMGALYFNKGLEYFIELDKFTPDQFTSEAYRKTDARYKELWNNAVPYLEKAIEIIPDDMPTLQALKNLYARLAMPDKLKAIDERINNLKK